MIVLFTALLALASAPFAQATATSSPQPAPLATPAPEASLPATPAAEPSPEVSSPPPGEPSTAPASATPATATPAATAPSTPSPYKYRFIPHLPAHPAPGEPLITAVYLNDEHLHSQGAILIKVETNEAVVKVVSRSNGRIGLIPQVRTGDFEAASTLPKLPFIAAGMTVDLEFVATAADGRKTAVRVPVKLD